MAENTIGELLRSMADIDPKVVIAGAAGAFISAIIDPEQSWLRRLIQAVSGFFSALFLGPFAAHWFNTAFNAGDAGVSACGFLIGFAGIGGIKLIQDKIFGKLK